MPNSTSYALFAIISRAKFFGSYPIANLAFVALIDAVIGKKIKSCFVYEESNSSWEESDYYDLICVRDSSKREARIPVPLLEEGLVKKIKKLPSTVVEDRADICGKPWEWEFLKYSPEQIKAELCKLRDRIMEINPHCQKLASRYLRDAECQVCPYFASGRNKGAIHCTVHPCGYPNSPRCGDWEVNLGLEEALEKRQRIVDQAKQVLLIEEGHQSYGSYVPVQRTIQLVLQEKGMPILPKKVLAKSLA